VLTDNSRTAYPDANLRIPSAENIAKDYSRLRLTYEFDRLPALSGLASRHSRLCVAKWHGSKAIISGSNRMYVLEDTHFDPSDL